MYRNPEDTKANYQHQMGPELGEAFYALFCDVALLFEKWSDYETLFCNNKGTVDLLNTVAPGFFGRYQNVLLNDIVLHFARLLDPAETGLGSKKRKNMSIAGLIAKIGDASLLARLEPTLHNMRDQTSFVAGWRNTLLAHKDHDYALGKPEARKPISISKTEKVAAMAAFANVLNQICGHYCDAEIGFEATHHGGANGLIYWLQCAHKLETQIHST